MILENRKRLEIRLTQFNVKDRFLEQWIFPLFFNTSSPNPHEKTSCPNPDEKTSSPNPHEKKSSPNPDEKNYLSFIIGFLSFQEFYWTYIENIIVLCFTNIAKILFNCTVNCPKFVSSKVN